MSIDVLWQRGVTAVSGGRMKSVRSKIVDGFTLQLEACLSNSLLFGRNCFHKLCARKCSHSKHSRQSEIPTLIMEEKKHITKAFTVKPITAS